jgi:iron complex outermembrane receptor protein
MRKLGQKALLMGIVSHVYLSVLLFPSLALGQSPQQAINTESSGLDEVIVTAQRREQALQSVPISITAIQSQDLKNSGVTDLQALAAAAPGLVMVTSRGSATPYLRGVGSQAGDPGGSSSIATYIDGVYIQAPAAGLFSLNNVDRVEIIKGPQGTLFGRNATGGLIHIVTPNPSFDSRGQISVGYGNYDTKTGSFYGTTGLSETVAADFSFWGTHQGEGFGTNLVAGGDVFYRRELMARSKILWQATPDTEAILALDYSENSNDSGHMRQIAPGNFGVGRTAFSGSIYDAVANLRSDADSDQYGMSLTVRHEFEDVLLQSITAYRSLRSEALFDQDATPIPLVNAIFREKTATIQQEFTFNGGSKAFEWAIGLFYLAMDAKINPVEIRSIAIAPLNTNRFADQTSDSYAAFAQGTFELREGTRATLGARYSEDQIGIDAYDIAQPGNVVPTGTIVTPTSQSTSFNEVTWRASLDHDFSDKVMGYLSVNKGYKAGGYSVILYQRPAYEPETLTAYELGLKSEIFDNRARLNTSVFKYDYKNIQLLRVVTGGAAPFNIPGAEIRGIDVELEWQPNVVTGDFRLRTAASFLDGEYVGNFLVDTYAPNPTGGLINTPRQNASNATVRTPDWTLNISADYSFPSRLGDIDLNLSYSYSDGFFFDPDNTTVQPSHKLLNTRVALTPNNSNLTISVFGKNFLDQKYYTTWAQSTLGNQIAPAPPRTYGIEISYRLGE